MLNDFQENIKKMVGLSVSFNFIRPKWEDGDEERERVREIE